MPALVSVVHESIAKVIRVDDENQDKRCDASCDGDKVQQKAKSGQDELLCRVADGDHDSAPDILECLLHVKREFFSGEDGFGFFGKERVNGRHEDVDNRATDENE